MCKTISKITFCHTISNLFNLLLLPQKDRVQRGLRAAAAALPPAALDAAAAGALAHAAAAAVEAVAAAAVPPHGLVEGALLPDVLAEGGQLDGRQGLEVPLLGKKSLTQPFNFYHFLFQWPAGRRSELGGASPVQEVGWFLIHTTLFYAFRGVLLIEGLFIFISVKYWYFLIDQRDLLPNQKADRFF